MPRLIVSDLDDGGRRVIGRPRSRTPVYRLKFHGRRVWTRQEQADQSAILCSDQWGWRQTVQQGVEKRDVKRAFASNSRFRGNQRSQ